MNDKVIQIQMDLYGQAVQDTRKPGTNTGERIDPERLQDAKVLLCGGVSIRGVARQTGLSPNTVKGIRDRIPPADVDALKGKHLGNLLDLAEACQEVMMEQLVAGEVSFKDAAVGLGIALQRAHDLSGAANVHHVVHHAGESMEDAEDWLRQRLERPVMGREVGEDETKEAGLSALADAANLPANDFESTGDGAPSVDNERFTDIESAVSSAEPQKKTRKSTKKTPQGEGGGGGPSALHTPIH